MVICGPDKARECAARHNFVFRAQVRQFFRHTQTNVIYFFNKTIKINNNMINKDIPAEVNYEEVMEMVHTLLIYYHPQESAREDNPLAVPHPFDDREMLTLLWRRALTELSTVTHHTLPLSEHYLPPMRSRPVATTARGIIPATQDNELRELTTHWLALYISQEWLNHTSPSASASLPAALSAATESLRTYLHSRQRARRRPSPF